MSDARTYHRYVFDSERRRFVGAFEEMYRAETTEGFDSWHQDDLRHLTKRIALELLAGYNFARVLDVGCGKGAFTQLLKRANNEVTGLDLSETAVAVARLRFPDITFRTLDLIRTPLASAVGTGFDLVVCLETLSYLENWRDQLREFARVSRYALIALYLPENPMGFVKTFEELSTGFGDVFSVIDEIRLQTRRQAVLFGERR